MAGFILAYIVLWAAATSGQPIDRTLVYITDAIDEEETKLVVTAGDPNVWLQDLTVSTSTIFPWDWTTIRPGSVAVDYNTPNQYFLHDRSGGQIHNSNRNGNSITAGSFYGGSSPQVKDMTLDWIGQNIYYTDGNQIGLWSYKNERYQVIADDLGEPLGIDVDPANGYLFWAERQTIMKSSLWGTNAGPVVSGVNNVQTITVNPDTQMIYWINEDDNSVETADYNGQKRSVFLGSQSTLYAGIEIYEEVLFLLVRNATYIEAYNISTAIEIKTFGITGSGSSIQLGIAMSSPETQPMTQHPCKTNNGGCQHICIPDENNVRCRCQFGYTLNSDELSCDTDYLTDEVLFVVDLDAKKLYQVELATGEVHDVIVSTSINNPTVVTYDPVENMVYWVDRTVGDSTVIRRKSLTSSTEETYISLETAQCEALAIDPTGRKLYYGDNARYAIIAKSLDTTQETTLIQQNSFVVVTGIQIDVAKGHIYWTNANPPNFFVSGTMTVERADLSTGGNKMTIISDTDIQNPSGVALGLPEGKLYWCDRFYNKVERSDLDGTNREAIYDTDENTCYGVTVDSTYVYVTGGRAIIRINKATKEVSYLGTPFYWRIVGITGYSSSYMPFVPPNARPTMGKGHQLAVHQTAMFLVVINLLALFE